MSILTWILLFTLFGGVLSALAAGLFLLVPIGARNRMLPHLISFATGALSGAAFLALLPHALETAGPGSYHAIGLTILAGLFAFFLMEKFVLWRHCHHDICETHTPEQHHRDAASGIIILVGDGVHNFLDGVLIAAAFLTDVSLGIVTSVAVVAHEIPQEVGDLAVLLNGGMSATKALLLNLAASLTAVGGGLIGYFWLNEAQHLLPFAVAVAASSFVYVAVADLIPGLHKRVEPSASAQQVLLIAMGVGLIYYTHSIMH